MHPLIPEEVPTSCQDKSTDRACGSRPIRQGKWLRIVKIDVAGKITFPVPSLDSDSAPRIGGPATRRLGVTRTTGRFNCVAIDRACINGTVRRLQSSRWQFRDARDFPPGDRPPPTSSRGCTRSRGVRVHRGEPLLLGVDEEYQISYRRRVVFP
jgi:hypothetical protein